MATQSDGGITYDVLGQAGAVEADAALRVSADAALTLGWDAADGTGAFDVSVAPVAAPEVELRR